MTNLRKIRMDRKISQYRAAKLLGMTESHLSKWETGKVAPSLPSLLKLARFYGVALEQLLGDAAEAATAVM